MECLRKQQGYTNASEADYLDSKPVTNEEALRALEEGAAIARIRLEETESPAEWKRVADAAGMQAAEAMQLRNVLSSADEPLQNQLIYRHENQEAEEKGQDSDCNASCALFWLDIYSL